MKYSYNWIRELVPGLHAGPANLMKVITMKTAECEGVEQAGAPLASASLARVITFQDRLAVVETERYGEKTVVCGAENCRPGLWTAYLPVGKKVVHGVESDGMLASGSELDINKDHTGIVELAPGQKLDLIPDHVIEVDNKSLTHRPDLWGHLGMAREVAAITGGELRDPVNISLVPQGPAQIDVQVSDPVLCPRYSALVFENATVQPSPLWLQYRLQSIGLNPINNIVDVTNLVMAELAQPMHAFDAGKLRGGTIFVRPARESESFVALNDQTYHLTPAHLVIADAQGPVALAGLIGGRDSAIGAETTRLVFESANFQAESVRKTSSQLKLRTDASMRFEKAQDPGNTVRALARAIELLQQVSPGIRLAGGLVDVSTPPKALAPILVSVHWLSRKLGRPVGGAEVRTLLEALQFTVQELDGDNLSVGVPSWRATKDISCKEDLLEEVGRILGYDSIAPQPPLVAARVSPSNPERLFQRSVRRMAADQGFTEIYSYSFLSEEAVQRFGLAEQAHVRVLNPIASDQSLLRISLLPGVFAAISENAKHLSSFRFFEIGLEIHKQAAGLPQEIPHLMAVCYEREGDGSAGLFELKRLAECLMPGARVWPLPAAPLEHPERSATIRWRQKSVGRLFELHPSLGLEGRAAVLDVDLALLQSLEPREVKHKPLRRFPASAFDLSVIADLREPTGVISERLEESAGPDLLSIEYVRQYAGPPLPSGKKSVSFRLTVGAADRTLSSEEAGAVRARLIEAMRELGYELRV